MAKKHKKQQKKGTARSGTATKPAGNGTATTSAEGSGAAAPLEPRPWRREPKAEKVSAKERAALAKKAARERFAKSA
jgi:hypothetical protein